MSAPQTIKGVFQNGVVRPLEGVAGVQDGQSVLITFVSNGDASVEAAAEPADWQQLIDLVRSCEMSTGVPDLAEQHDHFAHG